MNASLKKMPLNKEVFHKEAEIVELKEVLLAVGVLDDVKYSAAAPFKTSRKKNEDQFKFHLIDGYSWTSNDPTNWGYIADKIREANAKKVEVALGNLPQVFKITSLERTPKENVEEGGDPGSYHMRGWAADIVPTIEGLTNKDLANYIIGSVELSELFPKMLVYRNSNHLHLVHKDSGVSQARLETTKGVDDSSTPYSPSDEEVNTSIRRIDGKAAPAAADPAPATPTAASDASEIDCRPINKKEAELQVANNKAVGEVKKFAVNFKVPTDIWLLHLNKGLEGYPKSRLGLPLAKDRQEIFDRYKGLWTTAQETYREYDEHITFIKTNPEILNKCYYVPSTSMEENKVSQKIRSLIKEEIRKLFDPI
jgi:hypothetical protein